LTETSRRLSEENSELQSLRRFLLAAAQPHADAEHIADGAHLFSRRAFVALEAGIRHELAAAYAGAVLQRGLRRVLLELVEAGVFGILGESARRELLRFLRGPRAGPRSDPRHALTLARYWTSRSPAIKETARALLREGEPARAEALLTTMAGAEDERLFILRSLDGAKAIIVFGDPADPTSLSYGRTPGRTTFIESPDRCVATGWRGKHAYAGELHESRSATLTRGEALTLIAWIETAYVISTYPACPRGHGAWSACAGEIDRRVEEMARTLASNRGGVELTASRLHRGRPLGPVLEEEKKTEKKKKKGGTT
jgi:hypothetical protein